MSDKEIEAIVSKINEIMSENIASRDIQTLWIARLTMLLSNHYNRLIPEPDKNLVYNPDMKCEQAPARPQPRAHGSPPEAIENVDEYVDIIVERGVPTEMFNKLKDANAHTKPIYDTTTYPGTWNRHVLVKLPIELLREAAREARK